jgi:hypothetical protein
MTDELTPEQEEEHNAKMIGIAEGGDPNAPDDLGDAGNKTEEGDFTLPEGFNSVDELIEMANRQKDAESNEEEDEDEEAGTEEEEEGEESDPELLDALDRAAKAEAILAEQQVLEAVGGKEEYAKTLDWASKNLSDEQINFYDNIMENASPAEAAFAAQALSAMSARAGSDSFGEQGNVTRPGESGAPAPQGYQSQAEMQRDMADSRYQNDTAFQAQVMKKMQLTTVF